MSGCHIEILQSLQLILYLNVSLLYTIQVIVIKYCWKGCAVHTCFEAGEDGNNWAISDILIFIRSRLLFSVSLWEYSVC